MTDAPSQAMVQRHASQLPAEKVQTLMHLAKSIHMDLDLPAHPAQQDEPQSKARLPGAGGRVQLAAAETPRLYNFEQLVEALGCAQPNHAATGGTDIEIESSGAEHTHTQSQTSDLASAAGTVSPYNRY